VLETGAQVRVSGLRATGELIEVERPGGVDRHARVSDGWDIEAEDGPVRLRGRRRAADAASRPLFDAQRWEPPRAFAPHLDDPPVLDGTLAGFPEEDTLVVDHEDQYRRSEDPYPGPEEFSARAALGWSDGELFVAVLVTTPEPYFRPAGAAPLRLDNDPDEIHSDGLQLYVRPDAGGPVYGFIVVPDPDAGRIRVRATSGSAGAPDLARGAARRTDEGYAVTLALTLPDWEPRTGDELGFDLLVNRMEPGRERRAGQLVWSGGGGWVYLRGDRQDPAALGVLELG
jgi:hypothetical protein